MSMPVSTPAITVGPGKAVRFVVISADSRRSAAWVAWASKNALDVYIQCIPLRRSWKVSLHQTGSWHHGFTSTSKEAQTLEVGGRPRHLDIWAAPTEMAPGVRRGFCVVIPDAELRALPTDDKDHDVIRVPAPGPGYAAAIEFFFTSDQSPMIEFTEPIFDIALIQRMDGTALRICARQIAWGPGERQWLADRIGKAMAELAASAKIEASRHSDLRLILMGNFGPDQVRAAWEVALDSVTGGASE
jgi:hypothetical protein